MATTLPNVSENESEKISKRIFSEQLQVLSCF